MFTTSYIINKAILLFFYWPLAGLFWPGVVGLLVALAAAWNNCNWSWSEIVIKQARKELFVDVISN